MFKTILAAFVIAATLVGTAQAQTVDTLAEKMRQSISQCEGSNSTYVDPDMAPRTVYINQHCAKVQFQALQTYVDAASKCIRQPYASGSTVALSEDCKEAQILEKGLIKTFTQKPVVAGKK